MPNNPDPRLEALFRACSDLKLTSPDFWHPATLLAAIDARDPLRQPPGDEAVEAGARAICRRYMERVDPDQDRRIPLPNWRSFGKSLDEAVEKEWRDNLDDARRALTAALAVMAGTEVKERGDTETDRRSYLEEIAWAISECRREGLRDVEDYANRIEANLVAAGFTIVRARQAAKPKHSPLPEAPPDPKPEWTAEQRNALITTMRVVQKLARHVGRTVLADEIDYEFSAAFKPEPVWPPEDCKYPNHCRRGHGGCVHPGSDRSHAGERADG